jgi:hypothetical protein
MRCFSLLALTAACALGLPATGAAQEQNKQDDGAVVDSSLAVDSPDTAEAGDGGDSVEVRRPVHRSPGGNPYLREVREERGRRSGIYGTFGVGFGSEAIAALGAPGPYSPSRTRPTLDFGLGANVGSRLRLGVDGFVWFNVTGDGALETVTALMLAARVYPMPTSGLYVRAGGGIGRYGQDLLDDNCGCSGALVDDYGAAYALGAGFEVPVGRRLWLGPMVEMVRFDVGGPDGYRERVLNIGLSLTYDGPH